MAKQNGLVKKSLLKMFRKAFSDLDSCEVIDVKASYRLPQKKVRVNIKDHPFQLNLYPDGKTLHIYPEWRLDEQEQAPDQCDYILFDPERYFDRISGFYRLHDGDKITLGGKDDEQRAFLGIAQETPTRKLSITNHEGELIFKSHMENPQSCIAPLLKDKKVNQVVNCRQQKLKRLEEIFHTPVEALESEAAMHLISQVNALLEQESHRAADSNGKPGGVVRLDDDIPAIILGDLHAKPDNLLTVLSQNGYLDSLENRQAYLIIIGDAVHPEGDEPLEKMYKSMLMMDLILQLKLSFPEQVFYLQGNHDSFSEEISKGGIPQGLLWEKKLIRARGKAYRDAMQTFYDRLPLLAYSRHFITCHAAAPTSSVTERQLIDIRQDPKLLGQIINNRLQRPNRPGGYSKGDIKRLRKTLGVTPDTPFIVGHTPLSNDDTLWENVAEIKNHHIIYSSDSRWVGLFAQVDEQIYPFRYPAEPISTIINSIPN